MKKFLSNFMDLMLDGGSAVVAPLYDGISTVGPIAMGVCLLLSTIWFIFLGVKYAKAEDPGEKENLHKVLVNFIIGFVVTLILIAVVYAIRKPLVAYIEG